MGKHFQSASKSAHRVARGGACVSVKIGVLNDQSGVYAEDGGKYSVEAAKIAIEDFGGEVLGQKIKLVTADHQNKPDSPPPSHAVGMTLTAST